MSGKYAFGKMKTRSPQSQAKCERAWSACLRPFRGLVP